MPIMYPLRIFASKRAILFLTACLVCPALAASGATVTVTTLDDEDDGSANPGLGAGTSLREAVKYASSGDTIVFDASLDDGTVSLTSGRLIAQTSLSMDASGLPAGITISLDIFSATISRLLEVQGANVVEINKVRFLVGGGPTFAGNGGAILNAGTLTLNDCQVDRCMAVEGGGIYNDGGSLTLNRCSIDQCDADTFGGGVLNNGGILTISQTTFMGCMAGADGGAVYNLSSTASASLDNCTLTENSSVAAGAAVANFDSASLSLNHCTIANNAAGSNGGGIWLGMNAPLTTRDSILANNTAAGSDPDLFRDVTNPTVTGLGVNLVEDGAAVTGGTTVTGQDPDLAPLGDYGGPTQTMPPVAGPGSPVIDATTSTLGFDQRGLQRSGSGNDDLGAAEVISSLPVDTAADLSSPPDTPGIVSLRSALAFASPGANTITFDPGVDGKTITLTLGQLEIRNGLTVSSAGLAKGVTVDANGGVTGHRVLFVQAPASGVELNGLTLTGGSAAGGNGGAIFNSGTSLVLDSCTLNNNTTLFEPLPVNNGGLGGAIFSGAVGGEVGSLTMRNCTLTANQAELNGGAVYAQTALCLEHCTVAGNSTVDGDGGGIFMESGEILEVFNSIVAQNSAGGMGMGPDIEGDYTAEGVNIVVSGGNLTGGSGSVSTANPLLGPLGNYGGLTATMLLLPGSPAIDTAGAGAFSTDQRGYPRPQGAGPDIGAYEVYEGDGFVDTDADGMDDRLEPLYGFEVGVMDGALDADADGSSNADELGNQTNPCDPFSRLAIIGFEFVRFEAGGNPVFEVTWTTFPGLDYTLEFQEMLDFGGGVVREIGSFLADDLTISEEVEMMPGVDFLRARRN